MKVKIWRGKSVALKDLFFTKIAPRIVERMWWTQHFNGQVKRFDFIAACFRDIEFTDVIETGTFLGNSTIALACLSESTVHSIEINPRFFQAAKERIEANYSHLEIRLYRGTSSTILPTILDDLDPEIKIIFLYLDAHWGEDLPLFSEIEALNDWGGKFIALIDDFQIINDPGYGYDKYGDRVIGKSLIPLVEHTKLYELKANSAFETGSRRGTGILIHDDLIKEFSNDLLVKISKLDI